MEMKNLVIVIVSLIVIVSVSFGNIFTSRCVQCLKWPWVENKYQAFFWFQFSKKKKRFILLYKFVSTGIEWTALKNGKWLHKCSYNYCFMIFSGSILVYIEGFSPFVSSDISRNSIDGKSLQMCLVMPPPLGVIALKLIKSIIIIQIYH